MYVHRCTHFTIIHDIVCCEILNYTSACHHMEKVEKHCSKVIKSGPNKNETHIRAEYCATEDTPCSTNNLRVNCNSVIW